MDHGRIIALGTPAELVAALGADQIVELRVLGELEGLELAGLAGVRAVANEDGAIRLSVSAIGVALPALLEELERRHLVIEHLATHQATLEDVFVSLTGRNLRDA
jgi:ABC-2 type transport system ATP-binding protein